MGKAKPEFEVRLGSIRAVLWRNENKTTGEPWFNCEITRRFKKSADEWADSSSFNGLQDLAQVRLAVELAIEWLSRRELEQEVKEAK